jgi:hypothetical protein
MRTLHDSGTGVRFSRRLGEQVPDTHYACAIEGPRMFKFKPDTWVTIACLAAAAALIVIIKVYG